MIMPQCYLRSVFLSPSLSILFVDANAKIDVNIVRVKKKKWFYVGNEEWT